jgi:DNA-binding response OmpR family regulator
MGVRVLIVDDEAEFTALVADRLHSWGYQAVAAGDADEALAAQASLRPEVAVIGVQGRPARALELMRLLRGADPALKVILLLGRGAAGAGVRGMELGASDCLPLPLDLGALIDSLRAAVSPHTTPGP